MQHALRSDIDPDGLLEFSVVYTDRALNHMSKQFQQVMNDLSQNLKDVYHAYAVAMIPGGGTFAMEAVARQLATDKKCLILRHGWFSYRWTQILQTDKISDDITVITAKTKPCQQNPQTPIFIPTPIDEVTDIIHQQKPQIVFAPHVETASGIMLSDDYIRTLADAVHKVGGLLVIDGIASGCVWLDMQDLGIDVLLSAPQKGWSSTPCAGLVMLSKQAVCALDNTVSTSFSLDLKQWLNIMQAFENGGHAYHATMPTDSLKILRDTLNEAKQIGFAKLKSAQIELGEKVRELLEQHGYQSICDKNDQAFGVIVCYTDRDDIHKGVAFLQQGVQIASGVPLKVGEPDDFKTFRVGLFGLDKLKDVDATVARLKTALQAVNKTTKS
ncbi:Serine-pyruvate aminotransferase/ aspartate aminotransferase-like protein [Moraxella macacae 0408225]|uniref:Serine-pyruvate aminotransferase/ aspartate aminotransferase-like protein n=1 Tax=Moraxella macacae 0408225 TaxID=1230338 RepID=L2F9M1_9GAMM|nr:aminotransferase class V-fold PLP-dependent enzyme [Moraxella macacae]ELA09580.1 Serine-pyruvate aminotransferase/ aspartate aminotransferase-like protein [Moraxella macacae 0408225]